MISSFAFIYSFSETRRWRFSFLKWSRVYANLLFVAKSRRVNVSEVQGTYCNISNRRYATFNFLFGPVTANCGYSEDDFVGFFFLSRCTNKRIFFVTSTVGRKAVIAFVLMVNAFTYVIAGANEEPRVVRDPCGEFPQFRCFTRVFR